MENSIRLLGIAKKAGLIEIGEEDVGASARGGKAKLILSASDASDGAKRRAAGYAGACGAVHLVLPNTRFEFGEAVGRGSPGTLAITDAGIASGFVSSLAGGDPDKYGEAAALLADKAQRAMARKREAAAHRRNVRSGRKRRTI